MYRPKNIKGDRRNLTIQQSSSSAQVTSASDQEDFANTEVSHTCATNASYVVYEITTQWFCEPDAHNSMFYMDLWEKIGDTWSKMGTGYRWSEDLRTLDNQSLMTCSLKLPAYTGTRSYKLRVRAYNTSKQATLNEDEDGNHFDPVVKIYSVL